jgi:hypothetical protein
VVAGWSQAKAPQVFRTDNLWEFIDGAAETYLAYGFQEIATAAYAHAGGIEANVDLYRMADPLNAFGIYAQEADPDAEFLPIGAEGYLGSNVLNFWRGPYYVKITALGTSGSIGPALRALATHIAGRLPAGGAPPALIDRFASGTLVPHSVKYVPKDLLGQSYLANGFEAQYRDGKTTSKLAVVPFDGPDAATGALGRYKAFIAGGGKVRTAVAGPGDGGFAGDDAYYGRVIAVRAGAMMIVALGVSADANGSSLIEAFLARAPGGQ